MRLHLNPRGRSKVGTEVCSPNQRSADQTFEVERAGHENQANRLCSTEIDVGRDAKTGCIIAVSGLVSSLQVFGICTP